MNPDSPPLVLIGQNHFMYEDVVEAITTLSLQKRVIFLNNVGDDELPAFYRHAKIFVYPSWAEGFGMPILEAMASGIPVICSDTTSLPEIADGAAYLIHPHDSRQMSDAISRLLTDNKYRKTLTESGLMQARRFTWQLAAEKTLAGYKNTLCLKG
jgi:glycosyltransferase involved in cell wall biosynthesis